MREKRTILHVDLDAFYASVEQRDDPSLRGRPVIVGGTRRRGVVCAASYEARPFGVRSAMPMVKALELCPSAVVLPPRIGHYATVSEQFFGILGSFTPLVEGLSLDEAFLDTTAERGLWGDGPTIARAIKDRVRRELGLIASVGVAPSKFVAKIASDVGKPDGLLVVEASQVVPFLAALPVGRLWGVGRVTEKALHEQGWQTIGDIARVPEARLVAALGEGLGRHLAALAVGHDERAVDPHREAVSIGHEETFEVDLRDRDELKRHLIDQADRVAARLRAAETRARTITVKIKYANHQRTSRRATLDLATADGFRIAEVAAELLARVPDVERRGVRLCGVAASGFARADGDERSQPWDDRQLSFAGVLDPHAAPPPPETAREPTRGERLGQAMDRIRERFGGDAIRRAMALGSVAARDAEPARGPDSEDRRGRGR